MIFSYDFLIFKIIIITFILTIFIYYICIINIHDNNLYSCRDVYFANSHKLNKCCEDRYPKNIEKQKKCKLYIANE